MRIIALIVASILQSASFVAAIIVGMLGFVLMAGFEIDFNTKFSSGLLLFFSAVMLLYYAGKATFK